MLLIATQHENVDIIVLADGLAYREFNSPPAGNPPRRSKIRKEPLNLIQLKRAPIMFCIDGSVAVCGPQVATTRMG